MTAGFEIPIETLELPSDVVSVLKSHNIDNYGTLCCVTLGTLKSWGLTSQHLDAIFAVVRAHLT